MKKIDNNHKPLIAITAGDPAGIGTEIAIKLLNKKDLYKISKPVVIGSKKVLKDMLNKLGSKLEINILPDNGLNQWDKKQLNMIDLDNIKIEDFEYGKVNRKAGRAAIEYIFKAIELANNNIIEAVVTGPISKEAINLAGYNYSGHTEIFAEKTCTEDYSMLLYTEELKVIHVSTHVSLRKACQLVKKNRVLKTIILADQSLKAMGIKRGKIAVAGLNPHCGENGLFGQEEIDEIIPAIDEAKEKNIHVTGPIPPDTVFSKARGGQYDIVVVMYHDQGHIPIKLSGFKYDKSLNKWKSIKGVNITVGLPIIRTSVDHGVAFDIAGKGQANEQSMEEALRITVKFARYKQKNKMGCSK